MAGFIIGPVGVSTTVAEEGPDYASDQAMAIGDLRQQGNILLSAGEQHGHGASGIFATPSQELFRGHQF
jgi:hypothetical protein